METFDFFVFLMIFEEEYNDLKKQVSILRKKTRKTALCRKCDFSGGSPSLWQEACSVPSMYKNACTCPCPTPGSDSWDLLSSLSAVIPQQIPHFLPIPLC